MGAANYGVDVSFLRATISCLDGTSVMTECYCVTTCYCILTAYCLMLRPYWRNVPSTVHESLLVIVCVCVCVAGCYCRANADCIADVVSVESSLVRVLSGL